MVAAIDVFLLSVVCLSTVALNLVCCLLLVVVVVAAGGVVVVFATASAL